MALGKWTVKVHPDKGGYPLGHRASVYTPEGNRIFLAATLEHGFAVALRMAIEDTEEES